MNECFCAVVLASLRDVVLARCARVCVRDIVLS